MQCAVLWTHQSSTGAGTILTPTVTSITRERLCKERNLRRTDKAIPVQIDIERGHDYKMMVSTLDSGICSPCPGEGGAGGGGGLGLVDCSL